MNPRTLSIAILSLAVALLSGVAFADEDADAQAALEEHFAQSAKEPAAAPASTNVKNEAKGDGPSVEEMLEVFTTGVPDDLSVAARRPQVDLDIKFDFDSADLNRAGIEQLDAAGRALSDPRLSSRRFMLGGHTDDRGDPTYNRTLSLRRAQSAREYLIENYDISPERLETAGFGSEHPKMKDKTDQARKVNRRVVLEMIE